MKMKKNKIIISSLLLASIAGAIIYLSVPDNFPTINAAGSSAVSPLMTSLANQYYDADVVVQAGGSGLGMQVVVNGKKDIGMASKDPKIKFASLTEPTTPENEKAQKEARDWVNRKIKTITIAWDGMGVVYKPPSDDIDFQLNITQATIAKIYLAFAGFDNVQFSDIGSTKSKTNIVPYARDGGGKQSGTADAFFKDSGFKNWKDEIKDPLKEQQIDIALSDGQYGRNTFKTAESNSQAWSFFKSHNKNGSMIYLSAGFINSNKSEIEGSGFKIAPYGAKNTTIDSVYITEGYDWYRPLNMMVSLATDRPHIRLFAEWIISDNLVPKEVIKNAGYIELSPQQKETMSQVKNFWVPDIELGYNGANNG